MNSSTELGAVALAVAENVGPPPWGEPDGYPSSVALCILDSIWSIGVKYQGVINVVSAYRKIRADEGGEADTDSAIDLIATIDSVGGPETFADLVGNRQRTSSTNGILKAQAVRNAATIVEASHAETMEDLKALSAEQLELLGSTWSRAHGQGSGISFTYFLMLTGVEDVKADRMICAFVSDALGRTATPGESRALVTSVLERDYPNDSLLSLDHAIWRYQRAR